MRMKEIPHEKIVIYKSKNKEVKLEVAFKNETIWLTQAQMTLLFARDRTVITKHINNVFKEGELAEKSNVQNMHIAPYNEPIGFFFGQPNAVRHRAKSKWRDQLGNRAGQRRISKALSSP